MVSYATEPLTRMEQRTVAIAAAPRATSDAPSAAVLTLGEGPLVVDVIPAALLTEEHRRAWALLDEAQPAPANPFLALAWVQEWYDKFVPVEDRLVLLVRREQGQGRAEDVVAIAPLHVQRPRVGPLTVARRLLPVGAGLGQTAYEIPGLLCRADQAVQAERAIVSACLELPADWAEIALTPEQGWFDRQWALGTDAAVGFGEFSRPRACVILPLQDSWEATRSNLKRNIKESIRRSANRLAKDPRTVEVVRRGEDLDRCTVERFLALHQARAELSRSVERRHPDSYRDERNRGLMLDALPRLGRQGRASMFELYLDGTHVGSQLALHAAGTSYVHSSGFREDTWSLGVVTHLQAELVRHAIERGDSVVNFSPGPNVSKTRWSEDLWVTSEFVFGAGPRSLTPRLAAFQMLSSLRATLDNVVRQQA